jgi:hypothetical protein
MALSFLKRRLAGLRCAALVAGPVAGAGLQPAPFVNDRVITQFEVDQRANS